MLALEFLAWWYGQGWLEIWRSIGDYSHKTMQFFSIPILLRTLFEPWRRIISYPGAGLSNHLRAMVDNLFSRVIGLVVRTLVMFIACMATIFIVLFGFVLAVIWPFLPFVVIGLIIKGAF